MFFKTNPQGGFPSLKPSRSLRSPSWTEKNKKTFPGIRDAFSLDYRFFWYSVISPPGTHGELLRGGLIASGCDNLRVLSRSFDRNNNFCFLASWIVLGQKNVGCGAYKEQTKKFFLGIFFKWHIYIVERFTYLQVNVISHYKRYYWTQEQATQQALLCFLHQNEHKEDVHMMIKSRLRL